MAPLRFSLPVELSFNLWPYNFPLSDTINSLAPFSLYPLCLEKNVNWLNSNIDKPPHLLLSRKHLHLFITIFCACLLL
jgi:hypothetical protein